VPRAGMLLHGTIHGMDCWGTLTIAEQVLIREAMSGRSLAGMIQAYGMALRWAGVDDAPPARSYTEDEQRALVPFLAAVATELAKRGFLTVHAAEFSGDATGSALAGPALHEVLADSANWLWTPRPARRFGLRAPQSVRDQWFDDAYPTADTSGLPAWDDLSVAQQRCSCALLSSAAC
jgi:hypothetical protein